MDKNLYFQLTNLLCCAFQIKLFTAIPGEIVGALAVLTGEPSFFTFKAKTEAKVVIISKNDFYS